MHVSKQRKEKKVVKVNIELQEDFTRSLNLNWDFISISTITAAKSLQSCPTLYDPTDGSPPSSPLPGDSPGKNTGMGCHFLRQCMKMKSESEVAQSCPTLSYPTDCSLPGSAVYGIFQARVLEWGAIVFSPTITTILLISRHT